MRTKTCVVMINSWRDSSGRESLAGENKLKALISYSFFFEKQVNLISSGKFDFHICSKGPRALEERVATIEKA